ncbi:MAG: hypothetical protein ACTSXZ_11790 [Alphaproteobacteria bacterium]
MHPLPVFFEAQARPVGVFRDAIIPHLSEIFLFVHASFPRGSGVRNLELELHITHAARRQSGGGEKDRDIGKKGEKERIQPTRSPVAQNRTMFYSNPAPMTQNWFVSSGGYFAQNRSAHPLSPGVGG